MANNKKFIVKNGLQSEENVVIGTTTDNGVDKLQVTGDSTFTGTLTATQSTAGTATVSFTNSAGPSSIIAEFKGDSSSLDITNFTAGDYAITNTGNGIRFYNTTDGLEILYNNSVDIEFSSDGIDFKREPTYNGDVFWNAGNDGAGSGLDADLIDGLDSTQFLRSDEDDTMNGSLTITGNLTVNGNTTYVNTEQMYIADNIFTLNSDFTSGAPTESAGFEIRRGNLANSELIWDETNDYWKLISGGTDLGRIITTADEARNGGTFDADTLDQLDSTQFLRSDQNDTTSGNLTVEGDLTVGDGNGTAFIKMDGAGTDGYIASTTGEIGFLNASFNYALKVNSSGDVEVRDDIYAQRWYDINDNSYYLDLDGTSVLNNITLEGQIIHNGDPDTLLQFNAPNSFEIRTGGAQRFLINDTYAQVSHEIRSPLFKDSDDVNYYGDFAGTSVMNNIGIDADLLHNGDTDTKLSFGTDTISLQTGGAERLELTNTAATFSVDTTAPNLYAQRFYDSANNSFYGDFASTSVVNNISLAGSINRDGDTNAYITFPADDQFQVVTSAGERVLVTDTYAKFTNDVRGPRFVDADNLDYFLNPAGLSELNSANFYSGATTNEVNIGRNANERLNFEVTDGQGYIRYYQDETDGTNHSLNFEIQSSGFGLNSFNFNADVNAGSNSVTGAYGVFPTAVYAGTYYDNDNDAYYADLNNTDVSINVAGEILAGDGTGTTPTYSFGSDTNTGMYKYGNDILGFRAGGNDEFRIYSTYTFSPGSSRAPLFYDSDNTAYYGNFAGTSQMNRIDIDDYIRHRGDTNTSIGFNANDQFVVNTNGTARLTVNTTSVTSSLDVYSPTFFTDDYLIHTGDTNTYIGFNAADTFGVWTGGTNRLSVDNNSADFSVNVYAPRYYDSDNNSYYADPAGTSVLNAIGVDADIQHNGDTDTKINFTTDTIKLNTAGTTRLTANNTGVHATDIYASNFYGTTQASAPIFYDSDNVNYYADFANTDTSIVTAGKVGVGTTSPTAMLSVNKPTAVGNNPFNASNILVTIGDADTVDMSIRTDAAGNIYYVNDNGGDYIWFDSGASGKFAILNDGSVAVNNDSITYATTDGTPNFSAALSGNKFNVTGGAHLTGATDAYSIYGADGSNTAINEATFLAVNELGFSAGGGFFMDDTTTMKIRGNKDLFTTGNFYGGRYYDGNNGSYYVDPAGTSIMNRIDLNDYIRHNTDTNTYFGFDAADAMTFVTGGTERFNLDNDSADFSVNVYAPRYYDSGNNNYYLDPAGDSQLNTIDIDDYIRHRGDTNNYFGFAANDTFRVWTNAVQRLNIDNNSADFAVNVYAPRYYDSNDNLYYVDPASTSVMNVVTLGTPGNGSTTKGRFLSLEGNTDASGEGSARIFFAEHNSTTTSMDRYGMSLVYQGGSTDITSASGQTVTLNGTSNGTWALIGHDNSVNGLWAMRGPRNASYVEARGSFRAPIFYDSNNTAYYVNPASTSVTNVMRANRYQVDGSTYFIDSAAGDYGSIRVEGAKNSWAGYAINDDWVFMSDGPTTAGIYNDTDNEWSLHLTRNGASELRGNGVHQLSAQNGYGYAPNSMRSPIFYDSNDTTYYGNFAAGNTSNALNINGRINRQGFATGSGSTNIFLQGQDRNHFVWNTATNWGLFWATDTSAAYRHTPFGSNMFTFVGAGNVRGAWDLDTGDVYAQGEMYAGNYNLSTGTDSFPLNTAYGNGTSEQKLFDGNLYWEKRAIQALRGSENSATGTTSEYVKSTDAPGSSSYVLRTAAYRDFYSDYIEVEPGEEVYGEMWVKYISGSGGLLYYGIERFDKDKRPIAGNTGCTYFVASGVNTTTSTWRKFSGHTTIPTSHTAYSGSDGGGVRYVRIRILMNYNSGGALREFTAPILVRTNVQSRIRTDQAVYSPIYYDSNNTSYYLDPASTSKLNTVDASNFRDRDNTARYMNPASGGNVQGTWNWNNGSITNLNNLTFADPGPNEGIEWSAGNGWKIYESPDSLSGNSAGNLQFVTGSTMRFRVETDGDTVAGRYSYAQRFVDSNDGNYYGDFASTSNINNINVKGKAIFTGRTTDSTGTSTYVATDTRLTEYMSNVAAEFHSGNDEPVTIYFKSTVNAPSDFGYITFDPDYDNSGEQAAIVIGVENDGTGSSDHIRLQARTIVDNNQFSTDNGTIMDWYHLGSSTGYINTSQLYHNSSMRSPIFYDSNNTAYYGNFASTSRMNAINANIYSLNDGWDIYDDDGDTLSIRSNNSDHGEIIFRDANSTDCGRIYFDDDSHWGLKTPSNEWALYMERDARVYTYYNGTWEERTNSGYMEARGSYRAPIFYDSNDTSFYTSPNTDSRFRRITVLETITGNVTGYAGTLLRKDNRIIEPNEDPAGRLTFGFTSWANNNSSPYADYLHLRSYTDSSGGSDNLVMFKKSGIGMRIWQQTWNSGTAYSTYRNVALYGENPDGSGNNLYAARYYDEDNTTYYADPAGTSQMANINILNGNQIQFYTSSGNPRGYIRATESNDSHFEFATSGGEDFIFRDGGFGGSWNLIVRGNGQVLASSRMDAPIFYDSNNTAYYANPNSTSVMHTLDVRSEIYNDGWFRNDTGGRGMYSTPYAQHWYAASSTQWRLYGTGNTQEIAFSTSGNNIRGYVYANNSNDIGFLRETGSWIFRTRQSYAELYGSLYADRFYDRNNSAYYSDPASTSRFNEVRVNYITNDGDVSSDDRFGIYWSSSRSEAYAIYREPGSWTYRYPDLRIAFHTGIKLGANSGYNGIRFYNDYNMATQVMSVNNATDPLGGNNVYVNYSLQAGTSLRAPIFYDSNDTNFYWNGATTNGSRFRGVHYETMAYMGLSGQTRSSKEYYAARPRITSDQNYWTGSMGWGRIDMNTVADWGSGFIDSWSNPANQPSGTSHWVGVQAYHYSNGSSRYGWQMVGGPIGNLRFRKTWSGFQSWRTVPVLDVNDGNGGSMYAGIYYDSNDTGYYCNPSADSNFNTSVRANEIYARNWFRNDNAREGLYNQNTGCHWYSESNQYWHATGNNNGQSINLQLRSTYRGTIRMWLHGSTDGWAGFLNDAGQWKIRYRYNNGYSPSLQFREEGDESWTGNPGNDVGKIEYHSNRFYIVSGGNSNRIVQFRQNGSDRSWIDNNGVYQGTATSARWADVAERYSADAPYEPGQVLGINLDGDSEVTLYQPGMPLAGAVSTKPGVRMNDMGITNDKSKKSKMNPFIALKGRIPVHVNGDVRKGQWVVADKDGKGKGVDYGTPGINSFDIIGIALSDSENGEVEVKV